MFPGEGRGRRTGYSSGGVNPRRRTFSAIRIPVLHIGDAVLAEARTARVNRIFYGDLCRGVIREESRPTPTAEDRQAVARIFHRAT